jgi:hypothetical protein
MAGEGRMLVTITWHANPLRGDRFAEVWLPSAESVVDYGAEWWGFFRAYEGGADFIQAAIFPSKHDFERYWYSARIAQARAQASGLFQIPVLPEFHRILGQGVAAGAAAARR